ncbi:unnamed protein product [Caretta caretta]
MEGQGFGMFGVPSSSTSWKRSELEIPNNEKVYHSQEMEVEISYSYEISFDSKLRDEVLKFRTGIIILIKFHMYFLNDMVQVHDINCRLK